jgi:hypothetical protein
MEVDRKGVTIAVHVVLTRGQKGLQRGYVVAVWRLYHTSFPLFFQNVVTCVLLLENSNTLR